MIELLVVVAILMILAAMLLPVLSKAKEQGRLAVCTSNLRQIAIASIAYAGDYNDWLPHGRCSPSSWVWDPPGKRYGGPQYALPISSHPKNEVIGVGLLMMGGYIPEKRELISCPQQDYRENTGYNYTPPTIFRLLAYTPSPNYTPATEANYYCWQNLVQCLTPSSPKYYRKVLSGASIPNLVCGYTMRGNGNQLGNLRKHGTPYYTGQPNPVIPDSDMALVYDAEVASQTLVPLIGINGGQSPVPGWPRVHKKGVNVAYADGHVEFVQDEDRRKVWAGSSNYHYGNGHDSTVYDRK